MEDLESVIPHIPSGNTRETIDFLVAVFGFEVSINSSVYSELRIADLALGVLQSKGKPNQQSLYLRVKDIDAFWSKARVHMEKTSVKPPFDREYGMREIHVIVPATHTLLFIGSPIS